MSWDRWLEFLQMDGVALYVWGAYLAAPALMLTELVLLALRRREILAHLGWRADELRRS